jgi:hypothetical protein
MNDSVTDAAKAIPPTLVYAWQLFGHPISEVVSWLTAIYMTCLILQFGYRFFRWASGNK